MDEKSERLFDYLIKSRQSEVEVAKTNFWKHIIITIIMCVSISYCVFRISNIASEEINIHSETGDMASINNILGDNSNGEANNKN